MTLFETVTARVLRTIDKEDEVRTIAMSPRGELLASGDASSTLELHLLRTYEEYHSIGNPDNPFLNKVHAHGLALDSYTAYCLILTLAQVHERGLALSRNGHLAAVLTKIENSTAKTSRLVVYRLGVSSEGSERAAPLYDHMFASTDRISGVAFNPNQEDDPEKADSIKVFVYGTPEAKKTTPGNEPSQEAKEGITEKEAATAIIKVAKDFKENNAKRLKPINPSRGASDALADGWEAEPGTALAIFTISLKPLKPFDVAKLPRPKCFIGRVTNPNCHRMATECHRVAAECH